MKKFVLSGRDVEERGRDVGNAPGGGGVGDCDELARCGRVRPVCGEVDSGACGGEAEDEGVCGVDVEEDGRTVEVARARVRLRVARVLRSFCTRARTR